MRFGLQPIRTARMLPPRAAQVGQCNSWAATATSGAQGLAKAAPPTNRRLAVAEAGVQVHGLLVT